MIKVLIVDDSAFMRSSLNRMIESDPEIEVVGQAKDGLEALEKIAALNPDVITLDIEMPKMDGLATLEEIMKRFPKPVLMVSSLTAEGADATLRALELGALDYMPKYQNNSVVFAVQQEELTSKIKFLSRRSGYVKSRASLLKPQQSKVAPIKSSTLGTVLGQTSAQTAKALEGLGTGQGAKLNTVNTDTRPTFGASTSLSTGVQAKTGVASSFASQKASLFTQTSKNSSVVTNPSVNTTVQKPSLMSGRPKRDIVAIGVSTGGPPAVQQVLSELPANFPAAILIAQHMPSAFTGAFAKRLDSLSQISVKEAEDGDKLNPGWAYVCPGGQHISIVMNGALPQIKISYDPPGELYKPAANILNESVAMLATKVVGLTMTGMGSDGIIGTKVLKAKGGYILAQNEESCVVYGMPRAVVEANLADEVLDIKDIAEALQRALYK